MRVQLIKDSRVLLTTRDLVDDLDVPGAGALQDDRRDALAAVLDYLQDHDTATASDLQDALYLDHPAGYQSPRSWWKNCIYPGLRDVAEHSEHLEKAGTRQPWRWIPS